MLYRPSQALRGWVGTTTCSIIDIDKRIGQRLADKSAVRCDKSAPTVWPREFVNLQNRHYVLDKSALYRSPWEAAGSGSVHPLS